MVEVAITPKEVASGILSEEHLQQATEALRRDGFVALKDVVDLEHIRILREKLFEDIAALLAREDAPFNFNTGNLQQDPPPFPPYLFRDVLVNDMVIAVTKAILGSRPKSAFYSGNTALQSNQRQPAHVDVGHLWENMEIATPTFGIVINIPLVDMSAENGSTEIYPGTHLNPCVSIRSPKIDIPQQELERYLATQKPIQPTLSAGSVLLRDIRLWHAGMPNRTPTPRPMIALIHWCHWWDPGEPLLFPKGTEAIFEHPDLHTYAQFVDTEIDYIRHPHAYDFER